MNRQEQLTLLRAQLAYLQAFIDSRIAEGKPVPQMSIDKKAQLEQQILALS